MAKEITDIKIGIYKQGAKDFKESILTTWDTASTFYKATCSEDFLEGMRTIIELIKKTKV